MTKRVETKMTKGNEKNIYDKSDKSASAVRQGSFQNIHKVVFAGEAWLDQSLTESITD